MNTLDKILYLIRKNGFTELEFTQKAGLNKTAVTEWKKGKTKSYNKHIPNIAKVLEISAGELLDDTDITTNALANDPALHNQNIAMTIHKKIIHTLEQKNLKPEQLCTAIHVPASTLSDWLKFNQSIPSEFLIPICEFLQIDIFWLLSDHPSEKSDLSTSNPSELDGELILLSKEEKYLVELVRKLSPRQRIKIEGLVEDKVKEYTHALYPNQTSSDCQIGPDAISVTKLA